MKEIIEPIPIGVWIDASVSRPTEKLGVLGTHINYNSFLTYDLSYNPEYNYFLYTPRGQGWAFIMEITHWMKLPDCPNGKKTKCKLLMKTIKK